jgi:hypothetical protein
MTKSLFSFAFRARPAFAIALTAASAAFLPSAAHAQNFLDNLKGQAQQRLGGGQQAGAATSGGGAANSGSALSGALGGMALPAMSGSTGSNAAGVLAYCVKNNYLSASNAQNVKDKLLSKVGLNNGSAQKDNGYREGAAGLLQGSNGTSLNLDNVKGNVKHKACDYVLQHAKSFI